MRFKKFMAITLIVLATPAPSLSQTQPIDLPLPEPYPYGDAVLQDMLLRNGSDFPDNISLNQARVVAYALSCRQKLIALRAVERALVETREEIIAELERLGRANTAEYRTAVADLDTAQESLEQVEEARHIWGDIFFLSTDFLQENYPSVLNETASARIHNGTASEWHSLLGGLGGGGCPPSEESSTIAQSYISANLQRNLITIMVGSDFEENESRPRFLELSLRSMERRGVRYEVVEGLDNPNCIAVLLNGSERFRYSAGEARPMGVQAVRLAQGRRVSARGRGASTC